MKEVLYKKLVVIAILFFVIGVNAQSDAGSVPEPPQPSSQAVRPGGGGGGTTEETPSSPIDNYIPVFILVGFGIAGYYARKKQSKVA